MKTFMKKHCFLWAVTVCCLPSMAQYSISGSIPELLDGTVITLEGYDGYKRLPKLETEVKDGKFCFNVQQHINDVASMVLSSDDGTLRNVNFKMRNDQVIISLDDRGKTRIEGSHEQDAVKAYIEMSIKAHQMWGGDPTVESQWPEFAYQDSLFVPYCQKYGDTQQALLHIIEHRNFVCYPYSRCKRLLQYVDTAAVSGTENYKRLMADLALDEQWEPGHKFIYPLDGTAPDGRRWGIGDFKGKYTLIVVASNKCMGDFYRQTLVNRKELYTQLNKLGYEEYDWMMADPQGVVNAQAKRMEIPWVIVAPDADTMKKQYRGLMAQNATTNYFSAITFFFISPEGDILIHEKEWEPVKEKILETFKNMKPLKTKKKKH